VMEVIYRSRGNQGGFQTSRYLPHDIMKFMPPAGPIKFARAQ